MLDKVSAGANWVYSGRHKARASERIVDSITLSSGPERKKASRDADIAL